MSTGMFHLLGFEGSMTLSVLLVMVYLGQNQALSRIRCFFWVDCHDRYVVPSRHKRVIGE